MFENKIAKIMLKISEKKYVLYNWETLINIFPYPYAYPYMG